MDRLKALYVVVGVAVVSGVAYRVNLPTEYSTRADALDAGLAGCVRFHFQAPVRLGEAAQAHLLDGGNLRADGGLPRRYMTARVRARKCSVGGEMELFLPHLPQDRDRIGRPAFEVLLQAGAAEIDDDGRDLPMLGPIPDADALCVRKPRRLDGGAFGLAVCSVRNIEDGGQRDGYFYDRFKRTECVQGCAPCLEAPCVLMAGEVADYE